MEKALRGKAEPLESFSLVFTTLKISGFLKLFDPKNQNIKILHEIYRFLVLIILLLYCLQHAFYTFQTYYNGNLDNFRAGLIIFLPLIIFYAKVLTLYFGTKRIDGLIDLMSDPIFGAKTYEDEKYLNTNKTRMHRLSKISNIGITCLSTLWIVEPILSRITEGTSTIPSYMPFSTDTWPGFLLANFLDKGIVLWLGYGHFGIDCLITTLFSQVRVQLKIIKHHLEHLVHDTNDIPKGKNLNSKLLVSDRTVQERFVHCVQRYGKVLWFTNEVTEIFGTAIFLQIFLSSLSTCLVVYQASSINPFSAEFALCIGYYIVVQSENYICCFSGGMVQHESMSLSDSAYSSDWLSLSPRFRRQLVIAMARWIRPITPTIAGIIPLTLATFMTMSRQAYSLYTVLKSRNNRDNDGQRTITF